MTGRFSERMRDKKVRNDTRIVAGLAAIYCAGNHRDRQRTPITSDASRLGVYGRRVPRLCEECAEHIRYAEKRRAYCPRNPSRSARTATSTATSRTSRSGSAR